MSKGGGQVEMPNPSEYIPLVQAQADANRLNQFTPFGSVTYGGGSSPAAAPMGFEEWLKQNPQKPRRPGDPFNPSGSISGLGQYDPRDKYKQYVKNFDPGPAPTRDQIQFEFSPELQSLFDRQFDPETYDVYADDYMSRFNELLDPYRTQETDQFQQSMFSRGIPDNSEVYMDNWRPLGDQRSRQDLMAAQTAQGLADQRRMQDFNRLMAAMGGSQLPVAPVDVMGPANMALNANISNQQNKRSIWDVAPMLAGAYMTSGGSMFGGTPSYSSTSWLYPR